jgi:hypothetical protein
MGLTSLAYLMDIDWLRVAFRLTRKDALRGRGRTDLGRGFGTGTQLGWCVRIERDYHQRPAQPLPREGREIMRAALHWIMSHLSEALHFP